MLVFAAVAALAAADPPAPAAQRTAQAPDPQPAVSPSSDRPTDAPADGEVGSVIVTPPKAEPEWSRKLNLDPRGDFAREATPYYARPLTNGCRLTALNFTCKKTFW